MKRRIYEILFAVLTGLLSVSCVYDYTPEDDEIQGLEIPLVVIDGDINVGDITTVTVGYTQPLLGEEENTLPSGVSVCVESESGERYAGVMREDQSNVFDVDTRSLDLNGRYRLAVSVPGRGNYISSYKKVLISPQIDSITYTVAEDRESAKIEITTHNDNTDDFLYCKWNYVENWESNAIYPAQIEFDKYKNEMRELSQEEIFQRTYCFSEAKSVWTYIANTEKLSQNLIYKSILKEIANTDTRVMELYSISVVQRALDREAYNYWDNIKKNTSGTGGLFGPQPSDMRGNIVCDANPDEVVLGYINVSTLSFKRTFIDWAKEQIFRVDCALEMLVKMRYTENGEPIYVWKQYYGKGYRPYVFSDWEMFGPAHKNYALWAEKDWCTDCRLYSNSTKPDFWPR
ncbi:MAG: DUF4249 domain-containing protein [Bacteroidales bacterium]|nr:DUF4249 domain-containing protein [Bacteroidales bacterium]